MLYNFQTIWLYGITTYLILLSSWLICCITFEFIEFVGIWAERRIQSPPKWSLKKKAIKMSITNWLWLPFVLALVSPFLEYRFPIKNFELSCNLVFKMIFFFLLDDVWFYFYHRFLHLNPTLYKKYHKPHHAFTAPFCWTSHAVHPVEMMLQSFGTFLGPVFFKMSLVELWLWFILRQTHGVLDHIGYELPWYLDLLSCLPGVGGTKFHDDHHKYFNVNFASCFSFIDDFMGTNSREKNIKV